MAALDALNEEMGSKKTSISKYIQSKYPNLPSGHTILLRHHLNRMKDTGELMFWKNNYMRPNPNFIRRGRGRPRKEPRFETSPQSKPRGRPRNNEYGPGDYLHIIKKTKASSSENEDGIVFGLREFQPKLEGRGVGLREFQPSWKSVREK